MLSLFQKTASPKSRSTTLSHIRQLWSAPAPEETLTAPSGSSIWEAAFPGFSLSDAQNILAGQEPHTLVELFAVPGLGDCLKVEKYGFDSLTFIQPSDRQMMIAKFDVTRQGHGTGRREMGLHLALASHGNLDRVVLRAGGEAGGYMHARTGYTASDTRSEDFRTNVRELTALRLRALSPYLTVDELPPLRAALETEGPQSVGSIANQRLDLGPRLKRLFAQNVMSTEARRTRLTLHETFGRLACMSDPDLSAAERRKNKSIREGIVDRTMTGIRRGDAFPVGRYLMSGTAWSGKIDLSDKAQMKKVAAYIGAVSPAKP